MRNNHFKEEYGEFKGSTSTKLEIIFNELKDFKAFAYEKFEKMDNNINDLKGFKAWALGFGAAAGFIAGIFKDLFIKKG